MQYLITPYDRQTPRLGWWRGAFTNQELDWLQQKTKLAGTSAKVGMGQDGAEVRDVRRSKVDWMSCNNETSWVFERLSHVISSLNAQIFQFDIVGFGEPLQLTNYDCSEHGMYGWHQDYGGQMSRKLSLVLQLSDPNEYEGGELQIKHGQNHESIRKERGFIVVFPSYDLHQVTPVVSGSRQSLVAWISGPPFK